jgi:hypothetical protein
MNKWNLNRRLSKLRRILREECERDKIEDIKPKRTRSLAVGQETKIQNTMKSPLRKSLKDSTPDWLEPVVKQIAFDHSEVNCYGRVTWISNDDSIIMIRIRQYNTGPIKHPAEYWFFKTKDQIKGMKFLPFLKVKATGSREKTKRVIEQTKKALDIACAAGLGMGN